MTVYRKTETDEWVEVAPMRGPWWIRIEMKLRRIAAKVRFRKISQNAEGNQL
jgi:hypothetical protein